MNAHNTLIPYISLSRVGKKPDSAAEPSRVSVEVMSMIQIKEKAFTSCPFKTIACHQCRTFQKGIFSGLTPAELKIFEKAKSMRSYAAKDTLFRQGDAVEGLFCVHSGKIKMYSETDAAHRQIIGFVSEGEILGHSDLFSDHGYTISAAAAEDTTICFMEKQKVLEALELNPVVLLKLMRQMGRALSLTQRLLSDSSYKSVRVRFVEFLLRMHEKYGVTQEDGARIDVVLSRTDIAQAVGARLETIVRLIREFSEEKLISVKHKFVTLHDIEKLKQFTSAAY